MLDAAFGRSLLRPLLRPLLRLMGALALVGALAGCAATPYGSAYAPADFGSDDASRTQRLVRYCDRLAEEGKHLTALGLCARAHELSPEDPEVLMRIASLLQALDRADAAAQTYTSLLAQHPGHQEALYRLGKIYMHAGQTAQAAAQFDRAIRNDPQDPRAYNALGIIRDQAGEHQAAQSLYRLALEQDPSDLSARNNLGLSLALNGQRDEAIEVLAEAAVDPAADQTVLSNLEAAYAATTAALPASGSEPLRPLPKAPELAPQAIVRPSEPVAIHSLEPALPLIDNSRKPAPAEEVLPKASVVRPPAPMESEEDMPASGGSGPIPLLIPGAPLEEEAVEEEAGEGAVIEEEEVIEEEVSAVSPEPGARVTLAPLPEGGPRREEGPEPNTVIAAVVADLIEPPAWAAFEPGELLSALPTVQAPAAALASPRAFETEEFMPLPVERQDHDRVEDDLAPPAPSYSLAMLMLEIRKANA
ncbi:tetratricopeptide repeat protein [Pelagibius sp.]|uniref:tetratricopeptide repeat protein n=1 Tax=Pelagibius sp. TaxID=1931238 RepID=UPI00260441E0|nr:tetratricopeptide repeat protein [Pelagibius sp.]